LLADAMLGRLAKWLRLIGYDTLYGAALSDHQIVSRARAEGRTVLTRDRGLAQRRGIQCLVIHSDALEDQITEVVAALGLPAAGVESRCPRCNAVLEEVSHDQARPHVPAHVLETHRHFRRCPNCARYYWRGSHWERIQQMIDRYIPNRS